MMINFIISFLKHLWFDAISEAQYEYRKNHLLDPYGSSDDWRDEQFWR